MFRTIGWISILALFSGCSSLIRNHDPLALKNVKQVAVVGFSLIQPTAAELSLNVGSGGLEADKGGSLIAKRSSYADQMYASLNQSLKKNVRWNMLGHRALTNHGGMKQAYDATMKGWQNKMPTHAGTQQFLVNGIMDDQGLRILGVEGRKRLMKSLGVDALVTATVRVQLTGTTILGVGSRYPKAVVSFKVYGRNKEEPIWFDGSVEGEEAETSVGSTAFIDEKLLHKLSLRSAKTAFSKIHPDPST